MNNLKAERTLTAEELQAIIDGCKGVTPGPWEATSNCVWQRHGAVAHTSLNNIDHIARLDPDTVKAMALELQHLRSQSLSTQQPMGEVTNEMQIEALRLLKAHDEREDKVQEILEDLREIVLLMPAASRPEGLMKQAQAAVYAMRGRTRLMDDEAITAALHPNQESGE